MSYDIRGKTILITGANRGIGRSLVETFIKHGVGKVYAAVRTTDSVSTLVAKYGDQVVPVELDLGKPETITAAASVATDVEVVINNAGVLKTTTVLEAGAETAMQYEMDINVYGLIRMAQAFAQILKINGGGVFAQINSGVSMKTFPEFGTYSASKAAAYSVTQSLYWLLKEQGTAVLSVHPGPIATDMSIAAGLNDIAEPPELVAKAIIASLEQGEFHAYPDTMAKQIGAAYASFAEGVVEADMSEE